MELLQYKYGDAYTVQASSTDILASWRKFRVRANDERLPAEKYCSYGFASGGNLQVYNADERKNEDVSEAEWESARPVFFEDHKYNLTLTFFDAADEPRIIHPNKDVEAMFNTVKTASEEYIVSGSLDFLNQPGHFALDFAYKNTAGEHIQHRIEFDVLSPKLDTKNDLKIIIQQIKAEYNDLVFRYLTLTFQQFQMGREANNKLIWLSVFKQVVDNYLQAVRFIINRPHNKTHQFEEYRRAERIKGWTPLLAEKFSNDRLNDEDHALRKYYRTEQTETTLDTRENRFVKYTLQRIIERLSALMGDLGDGTSDSEIANLNQKLNDLQMLRRNSFFKTIGLFDGFRQQSMVLQQRSGYSQVYRYWIMLQNGIDLIQGETSVGVQPIWQLYELWCFLKVKQLVCKVLGIDAHNPEHIRKYIDDKDLRNNFDIFKGGSLSGNITYTNLPNGDEVEVGYQYSFGKVAKDGMRSPTTEQKPDIVMHIHKKEQGITLTYLFDAKYSVNGDDDPSIETVLDEPKPETINAMHHYRDAIYYGTRGEQRFSKEIIGGYILFPGRMDEKGVLEKWQNHDEKTPYFLQSIDEVNIGAFPLLPNEESGLLLETHLQKVLLNKTVAQQLEVSVPQRGLRYVEDESELNVLVILGVTSKMEWCVKNKLYPLPLEKAYENPKFFQALYILVHNNNDLRLMHINREKIAIKNRADMQALGYPNPTNENYLLLTLTEQGKLINTPVTLERLGAKMKQGVFVVEMKEICKTDNQEQ